MNTIVQYELREGDWLALQQTATAARSEARRPLSRVTWFGFVGAALMDLAGMLVYRVPFPFVLAFFSTYFALAYVLNDVITKRELRRAIDAHLHGGFRAHRVTVEGDGLRHQSDAHETLIRWPAIDRVGETTEHVIIHVAGSPTLCVPKRAFADPQALAAFTRELRDRHETSRGA